LIEENLKPEGILRTYGIDPDLETINSLREAAVISVKAALKQTSLLSLGCDKLTLLKKLSFETLFFTTRNVVLSR